MSVLMMRTVIAEVQRPPTVSPLARLRATLAVKAWKMWARAERRPV